MPYKIHLTSEELPEPHTTVIVAGGVAIWDGNEWCSQMPCSMNRLIQWDVKWWADMPTGNEPLEGELRRRENRRFKVGKRRRSAATQKCNADLLASCRELIEAIDDYECSVDDPPTPKHREMMLRAMKAVEKSTQANLRSESEEKAFRDAEHNEHLANHRKATQENGGVPIRLGIDEP